MEFCNFCVILGLANLQGCGDKENFIIAVLFWVLQSRWIGEKFYNFDVTSGPADRKNLNKERGEGSKYNFNATSAFTDQKNLSERRKKKEPYCFCIISSPVYS